MSTIRITVRVSEDLERRVQALAAARGVTPSEVVHIALEEYFRETEDNTSVQRISLPTASGSEIDQDTRLQHAGSAAGNTALDRVEQRRAAILARRSGSPLEVDPLTILNELREERDADITNGKSSTGH